MSNINVKHLLRIDSWTNWSKTTVANQGANLVLLKGEVGICTFQGTQKDANGIPVTEAVLFKVGDGTSKFSALKWVSGLAADVYAWAKKETPDWSDFPALPLEVEDKGTGTFVTDFTYANNKLTITRSDVAWGDVTGKPSIVNSVKATGDAEITMTPTTAASGAVEVTAAHAAHAAGTANTASTAKVEGYSATGTIKIPKITTNAAGHVTEISEETISIKMPAAQTLPTVNDGTLTLKASTGLTADEKTFSANDADNVTFEVKHGEKPTSGTAHDATAGSGRTYVTKVDVDDYGHIAKVYTATETDQVIPNITITDDTTAEVPTTDTVNVYKNLTASGHTLTEELVTVPTKAYVDKTVAGAVAGAVDYLGVVNSAADLTNKTVTATHGDFVRVATAFGNYHNGDLLIYNKPESGTATWDVIHGEEGDITEIVAGNGLTDGGSTGSVTLNVGAGDGITVTADKVSVKAESGIGFTEDGYLVAKTGDGLEFGSDDEIKVKPGNHITVDTNGVHHGAKPSTGTQHAATAGSGRTYVTKVDVDSYGHIAKVYTATETVTDTWRPVKVNGTQLLGSATSTKPLDLVPGTNVTLTPDATNGKVTINSSDITVNEPGVINPSNDGTFNAISTIEANGHSLNSNYYIAITPNGVDKRIADFHKKLATIATTGSVYDVVEGASTNNGADKEANPKYLVFYGGTSTDII